jgi:hypothetical protein
VKFPSFIDFARRAIGVTGFFVLVFLTTSPAKANGKVDFGKDVYPILKDNCLKCHASAYVDARSGRIKKPKGGLRLDSHALILMGYESDDKQVAVVVPGKPEESTLYTSTALDPDHDDIMPSTGDLLTKAQQATLRQWIREGSKPHGFKEPAYVNPKAKK